MSELEAVQSFIDLSRKLRTPAELDLLLQSITRDMGFDHYALIHHVDLSPIRADFGHMVKGELLALTDYPDAWVEQYISDEIVSRDPVLLASQRTSVGFAWSEMATLITLQRPHLDQLERGRKAGIGDGFTVPANVPGEANGSCNFVVETGRDLPDQRLAMAQLIGSYAFEAGRSIVTKARLDQDEQPIELTSRQLECIALAGRGKSDWEIGKILGLAEGTVKTYINSARDRYGVAKRVQVVVRAVYDGQLPLAELLR